MGTVFEILWPVIQPEDGITGTSREESQPAQSVK
jgi:hypothetical protein